MRDRPRSRLGSGLKLKCRSSLSAQVLAALYGMPAIGSMISSFLWMGIRGLTLIFFTSRMWQRMSPQR